MNEALSWETGRKTCDWSIFIGVEIFTESRLQALAFVSSHLGSIRLSAMFSNSGTEFEEQDAEFKEAEASIRFSVYQTEAWGITATLFADSARADFESGCNVPLIPAGKFCGEISFAGKQ
jgi:hypothetical protein